MTILLLGALTCMAQKMYNRSDFSFKTTTVKNAKGELSHVKIEALVGHKIIDTFVTELPGTPMETTIDAVGHVEEPDLNGDGYPDVTIYLGYYGSHPNDVYYEALIWDLEHHCFLQAEGYKDLPEPMVDEQTHLITTNLRDGPERRVTDYYGWQRNKIRHLRSETVRIDDPAPISSYGLLDKPLNRYDAKLDGRISVIIAFQEDYDNIVAGYIYYPKAKTPAPIMIVGSVTHHDGTDYYYLREYQPDGIITGEISIKHQLDEGWNDKVEGTWTNPKTQKEMKLTDVSFSREVPRWFTKTLLTPEDPGKIGRYYSFRQWHIGYEDYMGGHISFRGAGKNKVHFECCNVAHNIAEGKSEEGRPAVLSGNMFEYRDVNGCGYGFSATFYPRFVVLKTISDNQSLDCFGAGASFSGVYVKIKE